jgi:hypothetical protein
MAMWAVSADCTETETEREAEGLGEAPALEVLETH